MRDDVVPATVGWWARHSGRLVLLGLLVFTLVLWPFSGRTVWPWGFGLGTTILVGVTLGAIGARDRLGPTWILSAGLGVVVFFLIGETTPAVWGLGAGVVLTVLGIVAVSGKAGFPRAVWLTSLIVGPVLLLVCAIVVTIDAVHLHRQQERAKQSAHDYHVSKTLPRPRAAVLGLVEAIGFQEKTDNICFVFTDHARTQFEQAHDADSCAGAIAHLNRQVRDADTYVNAVWIPNQADQVLPDGETTILDACHLKFGSAISGYETGVGPQIGQLTFVQQQGNGSFITDYEPCRQG